jgi:glycolate oxidase FAD binding subunit
MSTSTALTLEQGAAHLAAIVGAEHSIVRGTKVVVAPAGVQQVAEVLRFTSANGLTVMPSGSGTKLGWGNPIMPDIELSMERICRLREHAWQDMTCTVEAGCSWTVMQAQLRQHGQMVALDPLWADRATVGGIIAVNDSGALRLKFGGLRDLIIGMTVVLADGTIAKTGGKVVKNVAGYDLHKLMTGSFGTLGVIAEVNFRLHPIEEHARTCTMVAPPATVPDAAFFAAPLRALMDSQMTPSCVQLRMSNQECALDIRIAAPPECLDEYAARIQSIFEQIAVTKSGEEVWKARQRLFSKDDAVVLKVSLLPSEICAVSAVLQQWASAAGLNIAAVAQATGLMTVALNPALDTTVTVVEHLRAKLVDLGGSVVALQVPDSMRGRIDVWDCNSDALPLMREIKRRFDPNRILNPGRFVGNI